MALIEWRDDFAIGLHAVDHEHRELIDLINAVYAKLVAGEASAVLALLGEIHSAIAAHFALEETQMRELGYPAREEHKADHERLLDDIRDIMDDYEDSERLDEQAFSTRLGEWFTEHFRTHDARLHKYLVRL